MRALVLGAFLCSAGCAITDLYDRHLDDAGLATDAGFALDAGSAAATDEDYAVYHALLQHQYVDQNSRELLISATTATKSLVGDFGDGSYVRTKYRAFADETMQNLGARSSSALQLENRFGLAVPVALLTEAQWQALQQDLSDLWKEHPGAPGLLKLSAVGYGNGRTQAVVYTGLFCGSLCGEGLLVVLEKGDDGWQVVAQVELWIS